MDVMPENINPDIVEIARRNPAVRQIFDLYLSGAQIKDDQPITWRDALELIVIKLDSQYKDALQGWKDQSKPKHGSTPKALVNEKRETPKNKVSKAA